MFAFERSLGLSFWTTDVALHFRVLTSPDRPCSDRAVNLFRESAPNLMRRSTLDRSQIRAREKEYRKAFEFVDRDKSGVLDMDELRVLFKMIGQAVSQDELRNLINAVDRNGDGEVDFEEFVEMLEREKQLKTEGELEQYFRVFDSEQKGYISAERLQRTLQEMGEVITIKEAEAMVRFADTDQDGRVSMKDFLAAFHRD